MNFVVKIKIVVFVVLIGQNCLTIFISTLMFIELDKTWMRGES